MEKSAICQDESRDGGGKSKRLNVIFKKSKPAKDPKEEKSASTASYSVLDIVKSCRLLTFSLIMAFLW